LKEINGGVAIIIALLLGLSLFASTYIAVDGVKAIKGEQHSLTVTGSAKKTIKSDVILWSGDFSVDSKDMASGYKQLKLHSESVRKYLSEKGVKNNEMQFSAISTYSRKKILDSGVRTNIIESYNLSQTVTIRSTRVLEISTISRNSTELLEKGIDFSSRSPQYFYTKLADLKIKMIGLATEDCKDRADHLLAVTGNVPGELKSARVGVFQITQLYSNKVSDYGINDTSSYEKEITSVVTCEFDVE